MMYEMRMFWSACLMWWCATAVPDYIGSIQFGWVLVALSVSGAIFGLSWLKLTNRLIPTVFASACAVTGVVFGVIVLAAMVKYQAA